MLRIWRERRVLMAGPSENCDVALETFADWLAHSVHFAPRSAEALTRMGIGAADFEQARGHWEAAMRDDIIVAERHERLFLFGERFAATRARLRAERRAIESLGPLPQVPDEVAPGSVAPIVPAAPAGPAPPPAPARATYQLDEQRAAAGPAEPPVPVAIDPDETLPIPAPFAAKAAIPFSGETPPERVAQMFDPVQPHARSPEPGPDETALTPVAEFVMPKTGTFRDQLVPLVVPILSLDEYAELRARLTVYGEDHAETLKRFGVASPQVHEAQRARFSDYFLRDPAAQAAFLKAMQGAIARVREERELEARPGSAPVLSAPTSRAQANVDATGEIDTRHVADVLREANILPFDRSAPANPPLPSGPQQQSGHTELIKAFDLDELLGSRKTELAPVPPLPMAIERFARVQAALTKSRDRDGVLRHFGLDPAAWQAVAGAMTAALTASESLRSRYEDLYRRAMQE